MPLARHRQIGLCRPFGVIYRIISIYLKEDCLSYRTSLLKDCGSLVSLVDSLAHRYRQHLLVYIYYRGMFFPHKKNKKYNKKLGREEQIETEKERSQPCVRLRLLCFLSCSSVRATLLPSLPPYLPTYLPHTFIMIIIIILLLLYYTAPHISGTAF